MNRGIGALVLLAATLSGCVPLRPAGGVGGTAPEVVDVLARLLFLEDARRFSEEELRAAAASRAAPVRAQAARTLGRLQDAEGLPLLLQLVQDPDTSVAAEAAFALGQLGDTSAVPVLTGILTAGSPPVQAEAAAALGKLRGAPAREALMDFLSSRPLPEGRDPVAEEALLAVWRHPRGADAAVLHRWAGAAHPEVRWRAVYALTRRSDPAAVQVMLARAGDSDVRARSLSMRGLAFALADTAGLVAAARSALLGALADPESQVRVNALRSLGTHRDPAVVAALERTLEGGDVYGAWTAAESLGRLQASARAAAPALSAVALDAGGPPALRAAALGALARVDSLAARAAAERLATDPEWRIRAAAGGILAAPLTEAGIALARDPDVRVSAATLEAARAEGDAVRLLATAALGHADVRVRTAALGALARHPDPASLPLLLAAYDHARHDAENDAAMAALAALAAQRSLGVSHAHAFFERFPAPADPVLHARAVALFADTAVASWGPARPIEPGRSAAFYRAAVTDWMIPALGGHRPRMEIVTERGTIVIELRADHAPLTVMNLAALAAAGYFDGQEWPRVVPNFVIQGGDPRGDTSGGPGYAIRDEINRLRYRRGTLGMALSGPDTGGSQFFITHSPQPHLDGGYTVFGNVVQGMEVVDRVLPGERIFSVRVR